MSDGTGVLFLNENNDIFIITLGKSFKTLCFEQMIKLWEICGRYINTMYARRTDLKAGIG